MQQCMPCVDSECCFAYVCILRFCDACVHIINGAISAVRPVGYGRQLATMTLQ